MMSDHFAIQQLINTYSFTASNGQTAEMAATYAEDGVWEVPDIGLKCEGHAAIKAAGEGVTSTIEYFVQLNSPAIIRVTGDRATAQSVIRECGKYKDKQVALEVLGLYDDELVRTADGWRFACRKFTVKGMHDFAIAPPSLHDSA
jgi:ketosteroid isomerase-like protein